MVVAKTETKKTSYPMFSERSWWALRKRFNKSLPSVVDASYLSSVLEIKPQTAPNYLNPLKDMGLINEEGKPTERANRWRSDVEYPAVCEEIRTEVYPQQLFDAFPDHTSSRPKLVERLKHDLGVGEAAAQKMAALYLLLLEADPTKQDTGTNSSPKQPIKGNKSQAPAAKGRASATKQMVQANDHLTDSEEGRPHHSRHTHDFGPSVHFNIQIHIPPDATKEQIEQTFASMAKHFAPFLRQEHE